MTMDAAAEINRIVDSLAEAWNAHDARAFASVFHDDADFTNVFGMAATGRDGIERFHAPLMATIFRNTRFRAQATRIKLVRPDVAVVDMRWAMSGAEDRHGKPWPDRHGLMALVVTPRAEDWAVAAMHVMEFSRGN